MVIPKLLRIIFRVSLIMIFIWVFAATVGQVIPVEFSDDTLRNNFYDSLFYGVPVAILLTLTGTLKSEDSKRSVIIKITLTVAAAIFAFYLLVMSMFSLGFGVWTDYEIIYRNKADTSRKVIDQVYDIGALGYGGHRIVTQKPFLKIFNIIETVDTTGLDKNEWQRVSEEGDMKFP